MRFALHSTYIGLTYLKVWEDSLFSLNLIHKMAPVSGKFLTFRRDETTMSKVGRFLERETSQGLPVQYLQYSHRLHPALVHTTLYKLAWLVGITNASKWLSASLGHSHTPRHSSVSISKRLPFLLV